MLYWIIVAPEHSHVMTYTKRIGSSWNGNKSCHKDYQRFRIPQHNGFNGPRLYRSRWKYT